MAEDSAPLLPIPPPLVGRAREQATLRVALNQARAGQGSLMLLSGKAGIGETMLIGVLLGDATAQGAPVLAGHG